MPTRTTAAPHCLPLTVLFDRFLAARAPALTPRSARGYAELLALLVDYLGRYRLTEVPCDPAFGVVPGTPEAARLGQLHREQRAALDGLVELCADFGERCLGPQGADRRTLRLAEAMIRDLGRWLRTARIAPAGDERRVAPHLAVVSARARPRTGAHRTASARVSRPALGV